MAVQSLISFDEGPKLLNDPDLEIRPPRLLESNLNVLNEEHNDPDEDECEDAADLNEIEVDSMSISIKSSCPSHNNGGLLQLSESHFNNVLLDNRKLANSEISDMKPDARKKHVGVFWDIQNCCISQPNQVSNVVQNIRKLYTDLDAIEGEFAVVCDVFGVNKQVLSTLNNLQANIFHVCSYSKNACDEKLKQLIYRFVTLYDKSSVIVLVSSDINFAPICSDLKYRQQVHVILVHSSQVSSSLIVAANECRSFESFRSGDKIQAETKQSDFANVVEIIVTIANWPVEYTLSDAETLLTRVSQNVGGKVVWVNSRKRFGIVLFKSLADAQRCVQHVHNRKLRGSTLIAKILYSDEAPDMNQTLGGNTFEKDLVQIIEKLPKLQISIQDLHQELLQSYPQRYHFVFQEFLTFLEAYKCKRIVRDNDMVRLDNFYHISAIGIRMIKIFQAKNNPTTVEALFDSYVQLYRLEVNDLSPNEIWTLFRNIFWIFARIGMAKNIVLLRNAGVDSIAKFNSSNWSLETAKICSILRSRRMTFQDFYHEYSSRFDPCVAASTFWYERFQNVFTIQKDDKNRFIISATKLYQFVDKCLTVIMKHLPNPTVCSFEELNIKYWHHFGQDIPTPLEFGFSDMAGLFESLVIFRVTGETIYFDYYDLFKLTENRSTNYSLPDDEEDDEEDEDDDDGEGEEEEEEEEDKNNRGTNYSYDYYDEDPGVVSDNEDSDSEGSMISH